MEKSFEKYKGIRPGKVLSRILEQNKIIKAEFARKVGTHAQILNDVLKGKRKLPIPMSLRIDKALGVEEGTFANLQTAYEIKRAKANMDEYHPDLNKIRPGVFWDTSFDNIDFYSHKKGVIQRIIERGDANEREEIYNFYGEEVIKKYLIQIIKDYSKSNFHIEDYNDIISTILENRNIIESIKDISRSNNKNGIIRSRDMENSMLEKLISNLPGNELKNLFQHLLERNGENDYNLIK